MTIRKLSLMAKRPMTLEEAEKLPEIPKKGEVHPRNKSIVQSVKVTETARNRFAVVVEYA